MPKITSTAQSIHHISLVVTNCNKASNFYNEILGMEILKDRPDLGYPGVWLAMSENSAQQIHLLEFPETAKLMKSINNLETHPGHKPHVALSVVNLSRLISRLEQAKIKYSLSRSGRAALFCSDIDGNLIELIETKN